MSLFTDCKACAVKFKSRRTLFKHYEKKHTGQDLPTEVDFFDKNGGEVTNLPVALTLPDRDVTDYKQWLSGLVECINGSLHPQLPGKWITLNMWQVKASYLNQLILDLTAQRDNIRDASHRRKPFYKTSTRRVSFKVFELDRVESALSKQSLVTLRMNVVYSSGGEIVGRECSARSALAAAKERAFVRRTRQAVANQVPTDRCVLVVNEGLGRISREFELIWWPNLYPLLD